VGHFTDGNISRIKEIFYPNGNRLYMRSSVNEMKGKATLYLSKQPKLECDGYFENGTMSGEGFLNFKDKDENKYTYEGTFKNGVAEGEAEVIIETKTLYFRIWRHGSDDQPKLPPTFKNGRLEGKTYIWIWKGETFKGGYKVTFEDGKIVQNGGIKDEQLKIIEEYLEKLYPVRCDVRYTPRL
jgi:hypothetical protein